MKEKKFSGGLVMAIAVTTAIVFMGLGSIDNMVSVIISLYPEAVEGEVNTLFLRGISFTSGYHLGWFLIVVGYFLALGIFCLRPRDEKEKEKQEEKNE